MRDALPNPTMLLAVVVLVIAVLESMVKKGRRTQRSVECPKEKVLYVSRRTSYDRGARCLTTAVVA